MRGHLHGGTRAAASPTVRKSGANTTSEVLKIRFLGLTCRRRPARHAGRAAIASQMQEKFAPASVFERIKEIEQQVTQSSIVPLRVIDLDQYDS